MIFPTINSISFDKFHDFFYERDISFGYFHESRAFWLSVLKFKVSQQQNVLYESLYSFNLLAPVLSCFLFRTGQISPEKNTIVTDGDLYINKVNNINTALSVTWLPNMNIIASRYVMQLWKLNMEDLQSSGWKRRIKNTIIWETVSTL